MALDSLPATRCPPDSVEDCQREIRVSICAIAFTVLVAGMAATELLSILREFLIAERWRAAAGQALFIILVAALLYGGLVYQVTRLFYLRRRAAHRPVEQCELESLWRETAPSVTVLVPSYMEEPETVIKTLLSAALQDYPNRRVVLLIDDPPRPDDADQRRRLQEMRRIPSAVGRFLRPMRTAVRLARARYEARSDQRFDSAGELAALAWAYERAAGWLELRAQEYADSDTVSRLLREKILLPRHLQLMSRAAEIRDVDPQRGPPCLEEFVAREYARLSSMFDVKVATFERKEFENLSHEPNKAMNLNAYIGLLGGSYRTEERDNERHLERCHDSDADLRIPDTEYLITLDADTLILPDYASRLIWLAERAGGERLAVVQTPYSAFPDAPVELERIAGATTDIQYLIHQGFTAANATYWVGANALLRKSALLDIETSVCERGHLVSVFIQDRTVIEDTESTVDLIDRGWELHNYCERLAYSATPKDFGALIVQRRRWANGGLVILPKLLRYLSRGAFCGARIGEGLLRAHYLISITLVNFGLVIILAVPFSESIRGIWLPLTALPYFFLYSRDLGRIGYRWRDVFPVYALNLLLIPVNIAGVAKSLQQMWTGKKIPFARTPKIKDRTATSPVCLIGAYVLLIWGFGRSLLDMHAGLWVHAIFVAVNAGFLLYALIAFTDPRESMRDLASAWRNRHGGSDFRADSKIAGQPNLATSPDA